jgi:hypothetical protein
MGVKTMSVDPEAAREARARRLAYAKEHLRCPYCEKDLEKWDVPDTPFSNWATEYIYVCVNAQCPYFLESWERVAKQGAAGGAYCFVYDPSRDWCGPMAARVPPRPRG